MNALVALAFTDLPVRMIMVDGVPWWVHNDICNLLGIKNSRDAAKRLQPWQKDEVGLTDAIGRHQLTTIANESGVYSLVLRSRKPIAVEFERWLTCDVLPSIRKTGSYVTPARLAELQQLVAPEPVPPRQGERFRIEREAFEAREGFTLLDAIKGVGVLSPAKLRSIEQHDSRISEKLYAILDSIGFDMKFIRYGEPRLSAGQKALCAAWQAGDAHTRVAMLSLAAVTVPRLN